MGCVQPKQNIEIKTIQPHSSKKKTLNFFKEQKEKSQDNTIINKSNVKAYLILMSVSEDDGQSCQSMIERQVEEMTNQKDNLVSHINSSRTSNKIFL